jgi:hypothetical protein
MSPWQILNSPFALTTITLLWGGIAACAISARWQRRAQLHAGQVQYAKEIMGLYQSYVRRVNGQTEGLNGERMDELHSQMLSQAKLARFLFGDPRVGEAWKIVASGLADAAGFKRSGHVEKATRRMVDVYQDAETAIGAMYSRMK